MKKTNSIKLIMTAVLGMFIVGCASSIATKKDLASDDLPKDVKLKQVDYTKDSKGLQWVSSNLTPEYYHHLILPEVELNPDPNYDKQIPADVLNQLSKEISDALRADLSEHIKVTDKEGSHVAKLVIHVTRATTSPENLRVTEVLPIGAVVGAIKEAAGTRDRSVRIVITSQIFDSVTGAPLAERVSVLNANGVLENNASKLTYKDIKKDVDNFIKEVRTFVESAAYYAQQRPTKN
ncbi:DUF3313 domain-containing protein [Vibrio sp. SS-MA-C1-2]|uniref:DUF3313 family protein n=1 Tax=Vibrio sp. SS-MA-C1-2 TaxID=2908646 RepID=UPI001F21601B|nr:DUF3313 family protein [Vibrio sp. SS-MA-C1-2]UJF17604.1 DUF3313 domain-containing protein [Vibrio sp. SS-MA-C1-2]